MLVSHYLVAEMGIGSEDRYLVEITCRQFGISKQEKYLLDRLTYVKAVLVKIYINSADCKILKTASTVA